MNKQEVAIFWFRRDLRADDNHGFYQALTSGRPVLPIFIFDTEILNDLEQTDSRVTFILHEVQKLQDLFEQNGSTFWIYQGKPLDAFKRLLTEYAVAEVFTNLDYEPYARERDKLVYEYLGTQNIRLRAFKDQVIFHKNEVVKADGKPYTVFTPYSKTWLSKLTSRDYEAFPSEKHLGNLVQTDPLPKYHHPDLGFKHGPYNVPPLELNVSLMESYAENRDFPAVAGTSRLGVHLRFGTVSIRKVTAEAVKHSSTFLNELIWRNFYMDILWHFPHVAQSSFKPAYDFIAWDNSEKLFARWCEGTTGYPLVDAGMRELSATGYMHNRVRMVTASFLCKHLLIDWHWGEAWFAEKLLDFELASNNGGWQWAAGSGCDAAPYFRVFNPELQQQKFDADFRYIKKWVPEYGTSAYPSPIVEHKTARERAIRVYKEALNER
ncbi:cryptochrome/photolyase family protein [Mangrovibacterium diazotrophicum]|uniref:Deoxyribodipyrimidine photo-lyase n=1 Tax=Mangrovibacterium diazotrophicum TaxID=1261403 RepID=A0A419W2R7_9BACT|nr:deoxyribodipyrimidine photo-lyase [Mangrovibacterium diazotrophicum]RKD89753.1 deoxyribodipyrimidine photo-lyase [Mangrovibacterium diazotrophicum]